MTVKMKHVRALLELDEPDYEAASDLGADALSHLSKLVKDDDAMLASKAAYLASMIPDSDRQRKILQKATTHPDPVVRVAVAAAAKNINVKDASAILEPLMGDTDAGVRKVAINSIPAAPTTSLVSCIQAAAADEGTPSLRHLYDEALARIGTRPLSTTSAYRYTSTSTQGEDDSGENDGVGMGGGQLDDPRSAATFSDDDTGEGMGGGDSESSIQLLHSDDGVFDRTDGCGGGDGILHNTTENEGRDNDEFDDPPLGFGGGESD